MGKSLQLHPGTYQLHYSGSGLVFHITDIYFEACQQGLSQGVTLEDMKLFERIMTEHSSEALRLYVGEQIYEKYKHKIAAAYQS